MPQTKELEDEVTRLKLDLQASDDSLQDSQSRLELRGKQI